MYEKNGMVYAGDPTPILKIIGVRPLDGYKLWLRFNTEETKMILPPELDYPCFRPLKKKDVFNSVYLDYGVPTWNDGAIDIAPEHLYKKGVKTV